MAKTSASIPAYAVLKGDKIWLDTGFFTVKFIDENGIMGTRTFSFDNHDRVKVALGTEMVIK